MFLQMSHQTDTEGVAGIQPLLLYQEVHRLRQTLVIPNPEALHGARLDNHDDDNHVDFCQKSMYLVEPCLDLALELAPLELGAGM